MQSNQKFSSIYSLFGLLNPLPIIPFTIEEITGCSNEVAKGAKKGPCFFI